MQVQNEQYSRYDFEKEEDYNILNPYVPQSIVNREDLTKEVFGWNPYWVGTAYNSYNYSLLSTVAYFSYEVDTATGGYTTVHYWKTTNLVPVAHAQNVNVVLTATNFGSSRNIKILSNPIKRQTLIDSLISLVQHRGADGVNIDFEIVPNSQRSNLVTFMTSLSNQFHTTIPGSEVSITLPAVDWNNSFNVPALSTVCDYMLIMGYDYHWSGAPNAGPVSPLQSGGFWGSYNVTNSLNYYLNNGADPAKLLLAVPYYGYQWPTVSGSLNSQTTGSGTAYTYSSMKNKASTYGRLWDSYSLTPWYRYQSGGWRQGWYDDSVSLGLKYDLVNSENIAGIGIWALSYDGSNPELWNTIAAKFTSSTGISNIAENISGYKLHQNYPNPFNSETLISFVLPVKQHVRIIIYDNLGNELLILVNDEISAGNYEVRWSAENYPSGVYYYQLEAEEYMAAQKMLLIK